MRAFVALVLIVWSVGAQAACRQALALGLDVSASVDSREYRLQLDGLAIALGDVDVVNALLAQPGLPVRIAIYEWSEPTQERIILPWTEITDETTILSIQTRLRSTQRTDMGPSTGLGSAMQTGFDLFEMQQDCWVRTLDISGDGKGNTGRRPQDLTVIPAGVTVNGLVIGVDDFTTGAARDLQIGELSAYYTAFVIRGPDAFVETAFGFDDYAIAMRRKLLRELKTLAIGQLNLTTPNSP